MPACSIAGLPSAACIKIHARARARGGRKLFNAARARRARMSLVVTGSPGVGKHTIAEALGREAGLDVIDANGVASRAGLVGERGEVDVARLAPELEGLASEGTLVVGHLAPYALPAAAVAAAVVIRRSPYELEGVYAGRRYPREKALDNLGAEILGVIAADAIGAFGGAAVRQVDATGRGPAEAAALARRALEGTYAGDEVDWLAEVGARGDVRRFFEH